MARKSMDLTSVLDTASNMALFRMEPLPARPPWTAVLAFPFLVISLVFGLLFSQPGKAAVYLSPVEFITNNLAQGVKPKSLWLQSDQQEAAKKILGHNYRGLRVRYWQERDRTAWILDEIGKDKPITIGVIIAAGQIEAVRILTFRESRGSEVRHPFFTRQYDGLSLDETNLLSGHIDGISGATLSVRAVTNVSRYALYLHQQISQ